MKEMVYKMERIKDVLHKEEKDGYTIAIMSYGMHPCAYIGIPKTHKYFGVHYDNYDVMPIDCHFGLTFSEMECDTMPWVETKDETELWWIGWDYGHCDDYSPYYEKNSLILEGLKKWTTKEILDECYDVIEQLKNAE